MRVIKTKGFPLLIFILFASLANNSTVAGEKPILQIIQRNIVIHSKETIKLPKTDISIFLKGIGSEHHSSGIVMDNAHVVATQHEAILNLYLEIIDGVPVLVEVFGYTLQLESCSAYHGICHMTLYAKPIPEQSIRSLRINIGSDSMIRRRSII